MKPINVDGQSSSPSPPEEPTASLPFGRKRSLGLRAKFVLFFSLILILACSALSWYYVEENRKAIAHDLEQLGTILLTSVVHNEHFRYAGLVAEDHATLQQFVESLMAVEDVVYVVITGADGTVLAQHSKGARRSSATLVRSVDRPLYPDSRIAKQMFQSSNVTPLMTPLLASDIVSDQYAGGETVYDFAMPVWRTAKGATPFIELDQGGDSSPLTQARSVSGVVQLGLTDARLNHELTTMVRNILFFTVLIIGAGALAVHLLALRITKPLRNLSAAASQVAEGHSPVSLTPSSQDEIGQLTHAFNLMAQSLQERNSAITKNLTTIKRQVDQLTTLHQVSAAIVGTLDRSQLLDTILQGLTSNLGFTRMFLMLCHHERNMAYVAQVAGVSPDIAEAARALQIPIQDDGSLQAELLIQGDPLFVRNLETVADRMSPPVLDLARRAGVTSFVAVPLRSHNQILGYLAADRGPQPCREEDLHMLWTITSHVAAAIDNARAYSHLEELTLNLEQRIAERTKELSVANERLQEHDRQRSQFFSVASHELRTPMTVIRSFTDNMRDGVAGPVSEQQLTYLTRIGHNINRLTRIINQLLDWSRLGSQQDMPRLAPVSVEATAFLVTDSLRTVAAEKSITLEVMHADGLPAVEADHDKLEQVFWNLIGNAIKFTPPGGRISVEFQELPEGFVQTSVADTGCGIDPGHIAKLFREFSKVQSANPSVQGAQLGLFITKNLVNMHKGAIWVDSSPGVGTTFYFTMPVCSQAHRLKV